MIALIIFLAIVLGVFGAVFWSISRSEPNESPALGNNYPYPSTFGTGLGSPYSPIISEEEEFQREAGHRLVTMQRDSLAGEHDALSDDPEPPQRDEG